MSLKNAALTRARSARRQISPQTGAAFALVCLALLAAFPSLPVAAGGGPSAFGNWFLGFVALSLTALMLFALLKRCFGRVAAGFASAGVLVNFVFVHTSGNLSEAYGLPLQAAALLLLVKILARPGSGWRPLVLGIFLGLLASLKFAWLGTVLVSVLFLLIAVITGRTWRRLIDLLWVGAGFLGIWAVWGVYSLSQQSFPDFFSQLFNPLAFSAATNLERAAALQNILKNLYQSSGFFSISLLAWLVVIPFLYFNESRFRDAITGRGMGIIFLLAGIALVSNGVFDDRIGRFYALSTLSAYRMGMIAAGLTIAGLSIVFLGGFFRGWSSRFLAAVPPGKFSGALIPLAFALLDVPVQLGFASLSGQADTYSVASILPSMSILIAFVGWSVLNHSERYPRSLAYAWLVILSLPILFTGLWTTIRSWPSASTMDVQSMAVMAWQQSDSEDWTMQWDRNGNLEALIHAELDVLFPHTNNPAQRPARSYGFE